MNAFPSTREVANPSGKSMVNESPIRCHVQSLSHRYDETSALEGIDLNVRSGEIVAVLGRNGSGKTTLFRLLSTLLPIQSGRIEIDGHDATRSPLSVRQSMGIIFQSPSLDIQLTVLENLRCQGALYGVSGATLRERCDRLLAQFGLQDRQHDRCKTLSGGLQRRVELAKGLLHQPGVMLLDEPSTGLDPAARQSVWTELQRLADEGVAVLLTTHLMDEAEKASRVVMLDGGRKVADDTPARLRAALGGDVLTVQVDDPTTAQQRLQSALGLDLAVVGGRLRGTCESASIVPRVAEILGESAQSICVGRPSLEDAFVARAGRAFESDPS